MAKYSLVMTPTLCRVAGCIRSYVFIGALTYLLNYTVGSGRTKPAISLKRLKIKQYNGLYKVVHGLSIAAKMYDLE